MNKGMNELVDEKLMRFYAYTAIWPLGKDRPAASSPDPQQELWEVKAKAMTMWEEIERLKAEIANKDKSLRDIQSALDAFGKMDIDSGMLFDIIQVALEAAKETPL